MSLSWEPIAIGVCGTDLEIVDGKIDPAYVKYPIVLGHDWCGRVIKVGANVDSTEVGARVVVEGIIPSGVCFECLDGNTNRCTTYDEVVFTRPGAMMEQPSISSTVIGTLFMHSRLLMTSVALEKSV